MILPLWAGRYIGLPFYPFGRAPSLDEALQPDFSGLDCWGLVQLILKDQFGIRVPSYVDCYSAPNAARELGALIPAEAQDWHQISPGDDRPGDVIVLRMLKYPMHVGLCLAPGTMIHIIEGIDSCIENYMRPSWRNRVTGIYRHPEL